MRTTHTQTEMHTDLQRRRTFLRSTTGLGGIALQALLAKDQTASAALSNSEPDGQPHFAPRAKNVIWLFMRGGVSHMESFDPKPALTKHAGKSISETPFADVQSPEKLKKVRVVVVNDANGQQRNKIYPLQVGFKKHGQSGIEVSNWFPHIGSRIDDIAVIRSMWTTDDNHGAQVQFHSGRHMLDPRVPTIGAWVNYGLGSLNENLPQFISMGPRFFDRSDGHYLGPAYDAVKLKVDPKNPLEFAQPEGDVSRAEQQLGFGLVNKLNKISSRDYPGDPALDARIKSYELAFRMQTAVPDIIRFDRETAPTRKMYGLDQKETRPFGEQLLAARRFAENGVRFIQIMHGDGAAGAWDQHSNLKAKHAELAMQVDRPIAGLLQDLKQRGMLDETLVVFATEFGRTPGSQSSNGRDHHPHGFSVWMAGGGIQGGIAHGSTDEIGFHAVEAPHYVTDVHATLLHQLGLHSHRLHAAGHQRLEQDIGHVIHGILA
ncbi:MAG: sulfatase [Planctomycetaceae bacterium TMED240]|nr:sulfatase [Rhodopirellula sp.]OUX05204.1 MAG: sulfatase [Planctomycetaceae bacterium TMED240]